LRAAFSLEAGVISFTILFRQGGLTKDRHHKGFTWNFTFSGWNNNVKWCRRNFLWLPVWSISTNLCCFNTV